MDQHRSEKGFTFVEVLMVMVVMAIVLAFAYPAFSQWVANAQYKEAARALSSTLRDARAKAIATNLEHRVTIQMTNSRFGIERGNRSGGSTAWVPDGLYEFPRVQLRGGEACDSDTDATIRFFPNGSCESVPFIVCMRNAAGGSRYTVRIDSASSGRVLIE